jgi:hypothetical protein
MTSGLTTDVRRELGGGGTLVTLTGPAAVDVQARNKSAPEEQLQHE